MRKKILISIVVTVIFALFIFGTSFSVLNNVRELENTKETLGHYNDIISNGNVDIRVLDNITINAGSVRFTIIDNNGVVKYDSAPSKGDNHLDRPEIKQAIENGEGEAVRFSSTTNEKMVYMSKKLKDGTIIRSSVPLANVEYINFDNMKYTFLITSIIVLLSILFSGRLINTIIEPVNELQNVTSKIAKGDLEMRVNITSGDELGALGKTFNEMADKLEHNIKEVKDKQSRLEAIVNSMQSGVIAVDKDNKIIAINPYSKEIFGIRKDVIGADLTEQIGDYDINSILEDGDGSEKEIKIFHPTEKILKIKKASIINGYMMIGKVIAIQDITEMKRLEAIRSQFVANVSHELKTPLTSIKGFAETLRYVEDDAIRIKFLDIIDKESERLTRLINDILVLSNIESNINNKVEEFNPNEIVEDAISVLQVQANNKNIELELIQENNSFIIGSKDKFLQLIINLVENSIKYSNEGAYVKVKTYNKNGSFFVKVEDNGIGIPKEDLPRIFERFYRVDKARKSGGTGLGLAIVKHIVKTFNGTIKVDSILGEGTKFIVKIKHI
ncbi:MAG: sensor histidine kinase [Clostridium sp.]